MSRRNVLFTQVCDIQGGTQPPKDHFIYEPADGYIRLLQIQDFSSEHKAVYVPNTGKLKTCVDDDILIARYGASLGRILTGKSGAYNVALVKTIPDLSLVRKDYLFHFLRSPAFQNHLTEVGSRAAQAGFNKDDLSRLEINLPSLEEQKRIAAILDKADSLRRKRAQAIALADDFLRATFLEMFGDKPKNNTLGDMCDIITGFAFQSQNYSQSQDDARLVRGVNVGIGVVDWSDAAYYPISMVEDLNRFILVENDVVLAMDRPWISSGLKCARVSNSEAGAYLVQRVARLRSNDVPGSEFILQNLMDPTFKQHCRITETTIPHISPKDLHTFPIAAISKAELAKFELIAQRLRFKATAAKDSKLVMMELQKSLGRLI